MNHREYIPADAIEGKESIGYKYRLTFTIESLPKMYNALNRQHYHVKKKEKDKWLLLIKASVSRKKPIAPLTKYKLKLTRFSSSEPDYDGLVSSWKFVIDALRHCEILSDDKLSNSGKWDCWWEKGKRGEGKIKVEVWSDN